MVTGITSADMSVRSAIAFLALPDALARSNCREPAFADISHIERA